MGEQADSRLGHFVHLRCPGLTLLPFSRGSLAIQGRIFHGNRSPGDNLTELLALASGLDPVPQIAFCRQARQTDHSHLSGMIDQRGRNDHTVSGALCVVVDDDAHGLANERSGVLASPLAFTIGRAGGDDSQFRSTTVCGLLAVHDEDLVGCRELVQPIQDRLRPSLVPRHPAEVLRNRVLAEGLVVLLVQEADLHVGEPVIGIEVRIDGCVPPPIFALDFFDALFQELVRPTGQPPLHFRLAFERLRDFGPADNPPHLARRRLEVAVGQRHLQVVDGTSATALAVAAPQARLGVDREVVTLAVVDRAWAAPLTAALLHPWQAHRVVSRNFGGCQTGVGVHRYRAHVALPWLREALLTVLPPDRDRREQF